MNRMTRNRLALFGAAVALAAVWAASVSPTNAIAQGQGGAAAPAARPAAPTGAPRVAVVDTGKIFNEMQETKDMRGGLDAERAGLENTDKEKRAEIEKLQNQRKLLKPDHPQFEELNKQILQKAIDFEIWSKYAKIEAERNQKSRVRLLFGHIETAVQEYAQKEGLDLVISSSQPEIPPNLDAINFDQLRALINGKTILFAGPKVDITNQVLTVVDARYKAAGSKPPVSSGPAGNKPATAKQGG